MFALLGMFILVVIATLALCMALVKEGKKYDEWLDDMNNRAATSVHSASWQVIDRDGTPLK